MAGSSHVKVEVHGLERIEEQLRRLTLMVRGQALDKALRRGGKLIVQRAKELVPVGDRKRYSQARKAKKRLKETIGIAVREYANARVAVVGPQYPAGAHGHLVEHGHRTVHRHTGTLRRNTLTKTGKQKAPPKSKIGKTGQGIVSGFVEGQEFLIPAARDVAPQINGVMIEELKRIADEATSG